MTGRISRLPGLIASGAFLLPFASAIFLAALAPAADKSGVTPNTISLPKGPGSIEGLGESFQPALNDGTAKYGVSIKLPPGTAGHIPALSLRYDSGAANGAIGFGWSVPLPFIQRQTDKGIPRYVDATNGVDDDLDGAVDEPDELDTFIDDSKEELVPCTNGFYFCENESAFVRYQRTNGYWIGTQPDGTRLVFGSSSTSRVSDVSCPAAFRWLLDRETDTSGNTIIYEYATFQDAWNTNQVYLSKVRYGLGAPPWTNYHFVIFQYGPRSDWFEDCRAGFIVRTGMRLTNIVVGTQGPALANHLQGDFDGDGTTDNLDRSYVLSYLNYSATSHWSFLSGVTPVGADGVSTLPPLTFGYSVFDPSDSTSATGRIIGAIDAPPWVMDNGLVDLIDLNGDALPDILKTASGGGAHTAYLNEGPAQSGDGPAIRWGAATEVASEDGFAWNVDLQNSNSVAHLSDMDGDGRADLWVKSAVGEVYYFQNTARLSWGPRLDMSAQDEVPPAPFGDPDVKTADMNFDKRIDIVQSIDVGEGAYYRIWFNLGNQEYSKALTAPQTQGYMYSLTGVELDDFNGDRVPDITRIRLTTVEVMAGLGYGRFADLVTVTIPDTTFTGGQVAQARLRDVTGDGLADLVLERAAPGELWYWVNLGNYTFAPRRVITGMPTGLGITPAIRWADINGNGTVDLLYCDSSSDPRIQSVDIGELIGCDAAVNMLTDTDNGIGLKTHIVYATSTDYLLADNTTSNSWPDPLPFPTKVIARVVRDDSRGNSYTNDYGYHDGYYDAAEKEFRGFGRAEQVERGDDSAPTLISRSWFDTGRIYKAMKGKVLRARSEEQSGSAFSDAVTVWAQPPRLLALGTYTQEVRFACALANTNTILELGQGTPRIIESGFDCDNFGNQILKAEYGIVEGADRLAYNDERITVTEYAINTNEWLIRFPMRQQIMDGGSNVISRMESYYDDETFSGANLGSVITGRLTMTRQWVDPSVPTNFVTSMRATYDVHGAITYTLEPLAVAPGGALDINGGHCRQLVYDGLFDAFPEREIIHVGGGSEPLTVQATYDCGLGVVTASFDFNGHQTTYGYDAFGRLVGMVRPGDTNGYPSAEFEYALGVSYTNNSRTGIVSWVETRQLDKTPASQSGKRDHYLISRGFVDGMGRALLSKKEEPGGQVSVSGAATFDARGKPAFLVNPFYSMLAGALEDKLGFEDIVDPAWQGEFHQNGTNAVLNLAAAPKVRSSYDATLRPLQTINPDGSFSRSAYEPLVVRIHDENDSDTNSLYFNTPLVHCSDGLGRLIRVDEIARLNADGTRASNLSTGSTFYAYNVNDQLTRITDAQNNAKTIQYDGLKRKTSMNDPDRGAMSWEHDQVGNVIETTDAKGQVIRYTFDGVNRVLAEDYLDDGLPFSFNRSPDVAYFYDMPVTNLDLGNGVRSTASNTRGQMAYVRDLSGEEHASYDNRGRASYAVKRVIDPGNSALVSYTTTYEYDLADRITAMIYPDNDRVNYAYDDASRLARIWGDSAGNIISNVVYGPAGQMTATAYGNGVQTTRTYDPRLRLTNLHTRQPALGLELIHFAYEFDAASNIRGIYDERPGAAIPNGDPRRNTQMFDYDDLYRLTQVRYSFGLPGQYQGSTNGTIEYRYDRLGNMLSQTSDIAQTENGLPVANLGAMDSGGEFGTSNRTGRAFGDPPGPHALSAIRNSQSAVTNRAYLYDANGNMLNIDGLACTWDFKDRLVAVSNVQMQARYMYDYSDRRITKRVIGQTNGLTTTYVNKSFEVRENEQPVKYVWNGNTRVARITGTLSAVSNRVQRFTVWPGWNLLSIGVGAADAAAQIGVTNGGVEVTSSVVECCYRWLSVTQDWQQVCMDDPLPAGSVFWLKAATSATLQVCGAYAAPTSVLVRAGGDYARCPGLEAVAVSSTLPPGVEARFYGADTLKWQGSYTGDLASVSSVPMFMRPQDAVFVRDVTNLNLALPSTALQVRFYHQDHLGSSSVLTDGDGRMIEQSAFHPFGARRNHLVSGVAGDPFCFAQKERDPESGLQYFEARFLAGHIGRFIRVDPVDSTSEAHRLRVPQLQNVYAYAANNPLFYGDPDGKDQIIIVGHAKPEYDAKGRKRDNEYFITEAQALQKSLGSEHVRIVDLRADGVDARKLIREAAAEIKKAGRQVTGVAFIGHGTTTESDPDSLSSKTVTAMQVDEKTATYTIDSLVKDSMVKEGGVVIGLACNFNLAEQNLQKRTDVSVFGFKTLIGHAGKAGVQAVYNPAKDAGGITPVGETRPTLAPRAGTVQELLTESEKRLGND
ncbi:MAG: hypothetical protein C0404_03040 [Verrucomicrobia bacterium]|nr:hypothetical protein [Verrucomicrobiota bacterium]